MPKLKNSLVPYFFLKEEIENKKKSEAQKRYNSEIPKKNEEKEEKNDGEIREANPKGKKNNEEEWIDDLDVPPLE